MTDQRLVMALLIMMTSTSTASILTLGTYMTPCGIDIECDHSKFLTCSPYTQMCDCLNGLIWDVDVKSCRIMEKKPCKIHHQHGPFATSKEKCISNSTCISGRCQCEEGYLRNGRGGCLLTHGKSCRESDQCATRFMLVCSPETSTCQCSQKGDAIDFLWDEMRQKCVRLVGSNCDFNSTADDSLECVEDAKCVHFGENTQCRCESGYSETPDKRCLLDYGQQCDNNEDKRCNSNKLLNCGDDGKCGCEFYGQMTYDNEVQECRMLAGEFCDFPLGQKNQTVSAERKKDPVHQCVKDAECVTHPHHKQKGVCQCVKGKFKSENGSCTSVRGHGLPCSYPGDCDESRYLTCVLTEELGGICSCIPNEMFYDPVTSSCLVLPGRGCDRNPKCGRNSNCDNGEYCVCNEGFVSNPIELSCHKLQLGFGPLTNIPLVINIPQDCSLIDDSQLLEFARCNCTRHPENQLWSESKKMCLGLVGTPCQFNSNCIDFAYCDDEVHTCQCDENIARTTMNRTCILKHHIQSHSATIESQTDTSITIGASNNYDSIVSNCCAANVSCKKLHFSLSFFFFLLFVPFWWQNF